MDKKMFNKSSNFFKKEGFYVILFVCLCVVATIAAVAARNSGHVKNAPINNEQTQVEPKNPTVSMGNSTISNDKNEPADAKAVQGAKPENANIVVPKDGAKASSTSTGTKASSTSKTNSTAAMVKPVDGVLARPFSNGEAVYWDSISAWRENNGIDIKADLGKPVVAAWDGVVEDVGFDREGEEVVLKHNNGLETVYANLDENVLVTKGASVKAGTELGTVGRTCNYSAYEKYGDHLHFEVLKGTAYEDPVKYVKYEAMK